MRPSPRRFTRRMHQSFVRITARPGARLIAATVRDWRAEDAPMIAAAMAYYALVSLAPLMVLLVSLAGLFFERSAVRLQILGLAGRVVQPGALPAIDAVLRAAATSRPGLFATLVALALAVLGAAGVFAQLQQALNRIWKATPPPRTGAAGVLRRRLPSFAMLLASGLLLGAAALSSAIVGALARVLPSTTIVAQVFARIAGTAVSLVLLAGMFAAVYRVLPDVRIAWRDVALGALVSAVLFTLANLGVGLYFAHSGIGSVYGAAGSLAVLLVWMYLTGQAVLLGAEFTHVWACTYGSLRSRPAEPASNPAEDGGKSR